MFTLDMQEKLEDEVTIVDYQLGVGEMMINFRYCGKVEGRGIESSLFPLPSAVIRGRMSRGMARRVPVNLGRISSGEG